MQVTARLTLSQIAPTMLHSHAVSIGTMGAATNMTGGTMEGMLDVFQS